MRVESGAGWEAILESAGHVDAEEEDPDAAPVLGVVGAGVVECFGSVDGAAAFRDGAGDGFGGVCAEGFEGVDGGVVSDGLVGEE